MARGAARGAYRGTGKSQGAPAQPTLEKPRREAILDLSKYVNEKIRVKFTGGREGKFYFVPYIYKRALGNNVTFSYRNFERL